MIRTVQPGERHGCVRVPSSKSSLHRLLIASALAERATCVAFTGMSDDVSATEECLAALGAGFRRDAEGALLVRPLERGPSLPRAVLRCRESASTLRFLLPVAGALGRAAVFGMEGRLSLRPHEPLLRELCRHGMDVMQEGASISARGQLRPGVYDIPGDISSQFTTGLLFALPLLDGDSVLNVTGEPASAGYVDLTSQVLSLFGIRFERRGRSFEVPGRQAFSGPDHVRAEGDWSGAACFLCIGALSARGVTVEGLDPSSPHADAGIVDILRRFGAKVETLGDRVTVSRASILPQEIDASGIPDLVPALCVLAAGAEGITRVRNAARLRFKESDRLFATAQLIRALGGDARETDDGLIVRGASRLSGGTADSGGDHRIAMAAALAASLCRVSVAVSGAESVDKSYPSFWEHLDSLEVTP